MEDDVDAGILAQLLEDFLQAGLAGEVEVEALEGSGIDGQGRLVFALHAPGVDALLLLFALALARGPVLDAAHPVHGHLVAGIQHHGRAHLGALDLVPTSLLGGLGPSEMLLRRQGRRAHVADLGLHVLGVTLQSLPVLGEGLGVAPLVVQGLGLPEPAAQGERQENGQGGGALHVHSHHVHPE